MRKVQVSYSTMEDQEKLVDYIYRKTGRRLKLGPISYGGKLTILVISLDLKQISGNNITGAIHFPGLRFYNVDEFIRWREERRNRVIVHIPHASLTVPDHFIKRLTVKNEYFNRMNLYESDYLIDEFKPDDLECLIFPYSRMFCDVERYREDYLEPMAGYFKRGVVYEKDANRVSFIDIEAEYKESVLNDYYDEHHRKFRDLVEYKIKVYDECLIIDLHSFSDEYADKTRFSRDGIGSYPDICIGFNSYQKMKDLAGDLQRLCNRYGYTNSFNYPYAGSIVPREYKDNEKAKSIMLEINKRIYLNDDLNGLDPEKAKKLKSFMNDFYIRL